METSIIMIFKILEVLTASEHASEHGKTNRVLPLQLKCIFCGNDFERRGSMERHNRKQLKVGPFCGKRCAGIWSQTGHGSKLTEDKVVKILALLKAGQSGYSVAKQFGVSANMIYAIREGRTWKQVPRP